MDGFGFLSVVTDPMRRHLSKKDWKRGLLVDECYAERVHGVERELDSQMSGGRHAMDAKVQRKHVEMAAQAPPLVVAAAGPTEQPWSSIC